MPHKMNTRSSERICGFSTLIKMYADNAAFSGLDYDTNLEERLVHGVVKDAILNAGDLVLTTNPPATTSPMKVAISIQCSSESERFS